MRPSKRGAGEGNRTLVISLEGFCSTIELHPPAIAFPATTSTCDANPRPRALLPYSYFLAARLTHPAARSLLLPISELRAPAHQRALRLRRRRVIRTPATMICNSESDTTVPAHSLRLPHRACAPSPAPAGILGSVGCPTGGGGWIRTNVGARPTDLQSAPFNHSGTPPREPQIILGVDFPVKFTVVPVGNIALSYELRQRTV
jgi:hypothetical protein